MSKSILITGASSGIGKSTAKLFQEKGWNVIATMRTPEKEEEIQSLENVLVTRLDVLDLESIDSALAAGIAKFGQIDVDLNNAGYGLMGTYESAKRESIVRQFGVNVQGLFYWRTDDFPYDATLSFDQMGCRRLQRGAPVGIGAYRSEGENRRARGRSYGLWWSLTRHAAQSRVGRIQ